MNKVLQVVGAVALSGAIAFGFVGCGENHKYSDEEYYSKMISAVQYTPNKDYTITMNNSTTMPNPYASDKSTMTNNLKSIKVYTDADKKSYMIEKTTMSVGDMEQSSQSEKWIQQSGDKYVSYNKNTNIPNTSTSTEEIEYSAKYVSPDHAKMMGALLFSDDNTVANPVMPTYEEFKESMNESCEEIISETGITGEFDTKIKFSTKKSVHKLDIFATLNTTIEGQDVAVEISYVIDFTDTMLQNVDMYASVTTNAEKMFAVSNNLSIKESFDKSLYKNCPVSEFADTEIEDSYTVMYIVMVNNSAHFPGNCAYNINLQSALNDTYPINNFADSVNIEWYYDKDYTKPVGTNDLTKSYNIAYYAKITPQDGYALILYSGEHNDIYVTNTMGEYELPSKGYFPSPSKDYINIYNGQEVTSINLEAGQTYIITTKYMTE